MRKIMFTAACALMLLLPGSASAASTAKFVPRDYVNGRDEPEDADPSFIQVDGDDGPNTITLALSGKTVTITDASGITAGSRCTQAGADTVTCPKPDTSFLESNGGDDRVEAAAALDTDLDGGAGADQLTGAGSLTGGEGDDALTSNRSAGTQSLDGGAGDDRLAGAGGDDVLIGGTGIDTLEGGSGDDQLDGDESGSDVAETDTLDGGPGIDTLDWSYRTAPVVVDLTGRLANGAAGENERLSGIENVSTGSGDDKLVGTDGPESFDAGAGTDDVSAGGGADLVESGPGSDRLDLGAGSDTVSYRTSELPVHVDLSDPAPDGAKGSLDTLVGVENVIGSQPDDDFKGDTLVGDAGPNILVGLLGSDRLAGGGGADKLYGEGRPIDIDSSPADGAQIDLTYPARDRLEGGAGRDLLVGGLDSDRLDGGSGDDRIIGGIGRGFVGGEPRDAAGVDVVDYSSRRSPIVATTASGGGARGEHDSYSGIEGLRGGSAGDVLTGKLGISDVLFGGRGNDRLDGLSGRDTLFGQAGRDTLRARDGQRDVVSCGAARDRFRADRKDRVRGCESGL